MNHQTGAPEAPQRQPEPQPAPEAPGRQPEPQPDSDSDDDDDSDIDQPNDHNDRLPFVAGQCPVAGCGAPSGGCSHCYNCGRECEDLIAAIQCCK